ncbi:MAG TPA: hypothetical protein VG758_30450 [Hyphomicrobiaceae bacterium]|jgi:hypothetical protein|nr:hypothetical protein [Hyphomicrobiaceae bacterium]
MTPGRLPLYLVALVALLTPARAAPLDADTCFKLMGEHNQLEAAGIEQNMAKGPAWAKANLAPEKLAQVQRFIELEELLLFRCRGKSLVNLPPEQEPPATGDQAEQDKEDRTKEAESPASAAPKPKASEPKPKADAGKKAGAQQAGQPAAQPKKQDPTPAKKPQPKAAARQPTEPGVTSIEKTPPKAKVDDAYKAPPPDPSVNPFAGQLNLPAQR